MAQHTSAHVLQSDAELVQAAAVMARAFYDYPLFVSVFPADADRLPVVTANTQWGVRHGHQFGIVLGIDKPLTGMVLLFPPGDDPFSEERIAASGYAQIADEVEKGARDRLKQAPQMFAGEAELTRTVTEPHWHLDAIAVDPAYQGQGIGSRLLHAIHDMTADDSHPVALVTHDARTIPLYQRHGYREVFAGMEPVSEVYHWGFVRHPQP